MLSKRMNFRKSSKRPFVILRFSRQNCDKSAYVDMEALLCIIWSYFPWMHVVQMFNMVNGWKHTLKRPFYIIFMLKKPCLKVQNLQYKFLDWKWMYTLNVIRQISRGYQDALLIMYLIDWIPNESGVLFIVMPWQDLSSYLL